MPNYARNSWDYLKMYGYITVLVRSPLIELMANAQ